MILYFTAATIHFKVLGMYNFGFRSGMPYIPKCGQRNANGIGVGIKYPNSTVKTAQFGEWPSMCAILNKTDNGEEKFVSGASLIHKNVVLTVAHYLK